jgi:hypothetical protein
MKPKLTRRQKEQRLRAQARGVRIPRTVDTRGLREYTRCLHAFCYTATRGGA